MKNNENKKLETKYFKCKNCKAYQKLKLNITKILIEKEYLCKYCEKNLKEVKKEEYKMYKHKKDNSSPKKKYNHHKEENNLNIKQAVIDASIKSSKKIEKTKKNKRLQSAYHFSKNNFEEKMNLIKTSLNKFQKEENKNEKNQRNSSTRQTRYYINNNNLNIIDNNYTNNIYEENYSIPNVIIHQIIPLYDNNLYEPFLFEDDSDKIINIDNNFIPNENENNKKNICCKIKPEIISKLKRFTMNKKFSKTNNEGKLEFPSCSICLTEIIKGSESVILPCGHIFHWNCSVNWVNKKKTCPICRLELK